MDKNAIPLHLANQYVRIVDKRQFDDAETIMWPDFCQQGPGFRAESRQIFINNLEFLRQFSRTFHFIGTQYGDWHSNTYHGETYCIASHFHMKDNVEYKMDMGIIYEDVIELRDGAAKYLSRDLKVIWTEDRPLGVAAQ